MLQNTSQGHKAQANPTFDPGTKYNSTNYKSTTSYDQNTKPSLQPPPPLLTLPTQHATATHPAPSPTHYHTPPPTQYLTTHQTPVPLYPNPPPLHAIPYPTSPPSTPTQSLHPPQSLPPRSLYPPQSLYTLSGRTGSALVWHSEVARSRLTQCSKSCDLQPALLCVIRGAQGVLPCVGWGVRPVNWIYRL